MRDKIAEFFIWVSVSSLYIARLISYSLAIDYIAYMSQEFMKEHVSDVEVEVVGKKMRVSAQDFVMKRNANGYDVKSDFPKRIQRQRTRGWKMPKNTVYVGRPTKWGNIYKVGVYEFDWRGEGVVPETVEQCVELYEKELLSNIQHDKGLINQILELRGKDLACWCPLDQPCHADVLLKMANQS